MTPPIQFAHVPDRPKPARKRALFLTALLLAAMALWVVL